MDYQKQGENFLTASALKFRATRTEANRCPIWDDGKCVHGDEYQITISRGGTSGRLGFRYWNSLNDVQNGKTPTAYDVLSCVASDSHTPETFADFCDEYGYDQDSRTAEKTFKAADKLGRRIRAFFTEVELEQLQEIN